MNDEMDAMTGLPMIIAKDLKKSFGGIKAVDGISSVVQQGELFGFLGPNGAGKTTTINLLAGLARVSSGSIEIGGVECTRNPKDAQHLIGVVPDESNLYPELTGFDNLCFCRALYGLRRVDRTMRARQLLDTVGLADAADREVAGYSKGMKRKLTIAAGIIHQPPVLFLDEPTSGIDVASARRIRQLIADLHRSGTTIVPTIQPTQEWYGMMLSVSRCPADLLAALASAFPALTIHPDAQSARIRIESSHPSRVGPLVHFFEEQGIEITEARRIQPSLEEEFVRLTGIDADALRREKDKPGGERMSRWIAPWNILIKDMRAYHRKPPNISWGLIFPIAWTAMFFIRSGGAPEDLHLLLPGVVAISILFGTTSLLSVTGTFETRKRAFERLLLAPIRLELLMLAKTSGAILFGVANAVVPILLALFLTDLSQVSWAAAAPPIVLIAIVSTFLGLSIAVSVSEVFEAQTFSNFFRFPMIFLCGLLFPIERLPSFLRPLSYLLPLTCGADKLHGAFRAGNTMPMLLDFTILAAFCVGLFALSVRNVQRRWIA